jgi:hypothetical protein
MVSTFGTSSTVDSTVAGNVYPQRPISADPRESTDVILALELPGVIRDG